MVFPSSSQACEQKVSLIRKELVDLTRDSQVAVVLNQLLYWCQRVKDYPLFLAEERLVTPESDCPMTFGWMYKTADELIAETLLTVTRPTMRKYLRNLVDEGWIEEKRNPDRKWDRTTFMRLNLKKIHIDLLELGYRIPGFEKGLFEEEEQLRNLTSKEKSLISKEEILTTQEESFPLKLKNLTDKEKNFPSKLKNLTAYTYTENTQKNTNRDHTHKACARENFKNLEKMLVGEPIAVEMIHLWEQQVMQKLDPTMWQGVIQPTNKRNSQLESLLAFHFKNDMRLWERFCVRVKSSNFMMGGGANGWKVTLDWILDDENLRKVLEGNYDNPVSSGAQESNDYSYLEKMKPNPVRDAEKASIISSIKDPVWKNWCTQLAEGVRLNELRMLHEPLSVSDLQDIADACFLECENERLVWVGSSDQDVLKKIDNIRLDIGWVYAKEYPKAHTFRTRLIPESHPQSGGTAHDQ